MLILFALTNNISIFANIIDKPIIIGMSYGENIYSRLMDMGLMVVSPFEDDVRALISVAMP